MDIKELSAYITSLLRSDAEMITAFLMGMLLTAMMAFSARQWLFSTGRRPLEQALEEARIDRRDAELAREEARMEKRAIEQSRAELGRKDAELAQRNAQITVQEAKLAIAEGHLADQESLVRSLRRCEAALTERNSELESLRAGLDLEIGRLRDHCQSVEADAASLRTQLAHASAEARHWAKWFRKVEEENARFVESEALQEG